jgi:hypothetical protein
MRKLLVLVVVIFVSVALVGCSGAAQSLGITSSTAPPSSGPATSQPVTSAAQTTIPPLTTASTVPVVSKAAGPDGAVTLGGLGTDGFALSLTDVAADEDIVKVFDEYSSEGWTDTGYAYVMDYVYGKVAKRIEDAKNGATSTPEAALGHMFDILKISKGGAKIAGFLLEGDAKGAGKALFDLATDYTGAPGKAIKYTLMGLQNAVDVWRDGEVEKAFQIYQNGSAGHIFGYGDIEAKDFDAVWDGMKAASRQLCTERIATENDARATTGLPALTPAQEDPYRDKVKEELRSEFDRRIALQDKIAAQQRNLDLILDEPYLAELLPKDTIFLRDESELDDSLQNRRVRFNHLIEGIFKDLKVDTVYSGQQQEGDLNGRISSVAMAEMIRGYFSADTEVEAKTFLQEYYVKLGAGAAAYAGRYKGTFPLDYVGSTYQVPLQFTVDASGALQGSWAITLIEVANDSRKMAATLSGQVADDGTVHIAGTATFVYDTMGKAGSEDGAFSFNGRIVNGAFTGTISVEGQEMNQQITATRP